jgi:hypothetical protein
MDDRALTDRSNSDLNNRGVDMTEPTDRIPLTEAIRLLRKEIRSAAASAQALDAKDRFRITEAELELTIFAEDTIGGGGEVGWWIFKAKAEASAKDAITHKVRLKLNLGDVEVGSPVTTR